MSLTKKHFEEIAKVFGNAYKQRRQGNLQQAFIEFDGGLMSFMKATNSRFDSIQFAKAVAKYSQ